MAAITNNYCCFFYPMKYVAIFLLAFCCHANAQPLDSALQNNLYKHVSALAHDSMQGRFTGTAEMYKAAAYIKQQFTAAGLKPIAGYANYYDTFTAKGAFDSTKEYNGVNVIGAIAGAALSNEMVIFCAHYDHVGTKELNPYKKYKAFLDSTDNVYNGANDNAAGTAALIEIAKAYALDSVKPLRTILFIAFSGEELGVLGSKHFTSLIENYENVKAVINLEMLGRPGDEGYIITGDKLSDFRKNVNNNIKNIKGLKTKFRFKADDNIFENLFARSDNYPFAQQGIIAHTIMGTPTDDTYYHTEKDDITTIDFVQFAKTFSIVIKACRPILQGQTFKYYR